MQPQAEVVLVALENFLVLQGHLHKGLEVVVVEQRLT
jgi:hypothetical protein